MKILVCIKHVPDLESMALPEEPPLVPAELDYGNAAWRMNRYDEYAVEAALQLRENHGAVRVDALTVGGAASAASLRRAIGMGVDHGIHLLQEADNFPSPFAVGGLIAAYAEGGAYDLILCGVMSEDLMQGLVGPIVAGLLKRPCLTAVQALDRRPGSASLVCEREVEGGRQEVMEIDLPALLTIQSGPHRPRYPALSKLLRANQVPLEILAPESFDRPSERQRVRAIRSPHRTRQGVMLEGTGREKADQLAAMLRARGLC